MFNIKIKKTQISKAKQMKIPVTFLPRNSYCSLFGVYPFLHMHVSVYRMSMCFYHFYPVSFLRRGNGIITCVTGGLSTLLGT